MGLGDFLKRDKVINNQVHNIKISYFRSESVTQTAVELAA